MTVGGLACGGELVAVGGEHAVAKQLSSRITWSAMA